MKKSIILLSTFAFAMSTQAQLTNILNTVKDKTGVDVTKVTTKPTTTTTTTTSSSSSSVNLGGLTSTQISSGLKEALNLGVKEGITKLGVQDGFYKNEMVKILLPEKLKIIDTKLRAIGMGKLADQGVVLLNRAAEDAVQEATPIFTSAITSMSFADAKNILLGSNNAATTYLQTKTQSQLFTAFQPKVKASLAKVGADTVWKSLISKYNLVTGQNITTDLNEYVTNETINGVFKMVADKESGIRNNSVMRTTSSLQKVFGVLDSK